jgi:hypothetical protein
MGYLGWDLPPGCTHRHIEEAFGSEGPCEVCGVTNLDKCICPECDDCGSVGDLRCYEIHGLVRTHAQIAGYRFYEASADLDNCDQAVWAAELEIDRYGRKFRLLQALSNAQRQRTMSLMIYIACSSV